MLPALAARITSLADFNHEIFCLPLTNMLPCLKIFAAPPFCNYVLLASVPSVIRFSSNKINTSGLCTFSALLWFALRMRPPKWGRVFLQRRWPARCRTRQAISRAATSSEVPATFSNVSLLPQISPIFHAIWIIKRYSRFFVERCSLLAGLRSNHFKSRILDAAKIVDVTYPFESGYCMDTTSQIDYPR